MSNVIYTTDNASENGIKFNDNKTNYSNDPSYHSVEVNVTGDELKQTLSRSPYLAQASGTLKKIGYKKVNQSDSPLNFSPTPINQLQTSSGSDVLKEFPFEPEPNVLDNYDSMTYHITFSILTDTPGVEKQIIIAETGATELDITKLILDTKIGADVFAKNISAYNFELHILEIGGAQLLDRIITAATDLNVKNYTKGLFRLDIHFMGRNSLNGEIEPIIGGPKNIWGWKVLIDNIATKVDETGCNHILSIKPIGEEAASDDYMRIPETYTIEGSTCGNILTTLAGKLNSDIAAMYGGIQFVEYKINDVPYKNSGIPSINSPFDHKVTTTGDIFASSRNNDSASVSVGIQINDLVDILMANSETAVSLANTAGISDVGGNTQRIQSTVCRVEKTIEYKEYYDVFNDYKKVITYTLVPYDTVRLITNIEQYQNATSVDETKKRIQYLLQKKMMQKEYDYYFTGKNTEVLHMDISINFHYAAAIEIMAGMRTIATASHGQAFNQDKDDRTTLNTNVRLQQEIQTLQRIKNPSDEQKKQLNDDLLKSSQTQQSVKEAAKRETEKAISNSQKSYNELQKKPTQQYVDDMNISEALNNFTQSITLRQTPGLSASMTGMVEGHWDSRRAIYSALLDQLYGNDGSLSTLDMTIKGDPFWLGEPGYRNLYSGGTSIYNSGPVLQSSKSNISPNIGDLPIDQSTTFADYAVGENVLVFKYNTPMGFDAYGAPKLSYNDSYTGFYAVYQVNHIFDRGEFTQQISAKRIPGSSVQSVINSAKSSFKHISQTQTSQSSGNIASSIISNRK